MQTHMGPMVRRHPALATAALWLAVSLSSAHAAPDREAGGALQAADPAHPAAAPVVELPPSPTPPGPHPSSERRAAIELWRQANERVAEFPRGHIDILRWEAAQPAADNGPAGPVAANPLPVAVLVARGLRLRPDLIDQPGLGALDRAQRRAELADVVRGIQGAWLEAVAARARLARAADVLENARTGAELGRRMVVAGNWSRMRHLQELQIETAARQGWLAARLAEQVAIERLARAVGLWQAGDIENLRRQLPADLPAPPDMAPEVPPAGVEASVLSARFDLQSERGRAARLPADDSTAAWQAAHARAVDRALGTGTALQLPRIAEMPVLNDHRSADAVKTRAELLAHAADLRSQAREAWLALQTHHALASLAQQETLARQEALEQEVLQRYNGMFVSTWDLLAAARERLAALDAVTGARLAYWLAEADWRTLLAGGHFEGAQDAPMPGGDAAGPAGGH